MNKNLSKLDKQLLRIIFQRGGSIFIEMVSVKYGISISDLAKAYRNLNQQGFVSANDDEITLTKLGTEWITNNQRIFAFSGEKQWREVPSQFLGPRIDPETPYAPRRSRLPASGLIAGQKPKKR